MKDLKRIFSIVMSALVLYTPNKMSAKTVSSKKVEYRSDIKKKKSPVLISAIVLSSLGILGGGGLLVRHLVKTSNDNKQKEILSQLDEKSKEKANSFITEKLSRLQKPDELTKEEEEQFLNELVQKHKFSKDQAKAVLFHCVKTKKMISEYQKNPESKSEDLKIQDGKVSQDTFFIGIPTSDSKNTKPSVNSGDEKQNTKNTPPPAIKEPPATNITKDPIRIFDAFKYLDDEKGNTVFVKNIDLEKQQIEGTDNKFYPFQAFNRVSVTYVDSNNSERNLQLWPSAILKQEYYQPRTSLTDMTDDKSTSEEDKKGICNMIVEETQTFIKSYNNKALIEELREEMIKERERKKRIQDENKKIFEMIDDFFKEYKDLHEKLEKDKKSLDEDNYFKKLDEINKKIDSLPEDEKKEFIDSGKIENLILDLKGIDGSEISEDFKKQIDDFEQKIGNLKSKN